MQLSVANAAPSILLHDVSADPPALQVAATIAEAVRAELRARTSRKLFFKASLFSEPAWDILLELFEAEQRGVGIQISALGTRSNVKPTTALRWIAALEAEQLIERRPDRLDRRRWFIVLTDRGSRAMTDYFKRRLATVLADPVAMLPLRGAV